MDVDFDDRRSYEDMQTYIAEDFQCSVLQDHSSAGFDHTLADDDDDDELARSAASYEHSSTVC